jgi:hypothetical protein
MNTEYRNQPQELCQLDLHSEFQLSTDQDLASTLPHQELTQCGHRAVTANNYVRLPKHDHIII